MKTKYDALAELATKATPGLWHAGADECPDNAVAMAICKENVDAHTTESSGYFFVVYLDDGRRTALVGHGPDGGANAAFIAAAREAVPTLIADVKALAEAMEHSIALLGPKAPSCCGSEVEWNLALDAMRAALARIQGEAG